MGEHHIIQKIGMNLDDASNGLFLRQPDAFGSTMSRHRGYHKAYSEAIENSLNKMDINQGVDVLERQVYNLQQRAKYLQQNGLPLYSNKKLGGATVDLWERWLNK